jgi:hypothetical protein
MSGDSYVLAEIQTRYSRIHAKGISKLTNMFMGEDVKCGVSQWGTVIARYVHPAAEVRLKVCNDPSNFIAPSTRYPTLFQLRDP